MSIPEPPGFSSLPKAEQIRYLQAPWDRIAESSSEVPLPETHIELAEQRLAEYRLVQTELDQPTMSSTAWARGLGDRVPAGFGTAR